MAVGFSNNRDRRRKLVVAVPVKDEEDRIAACVQSLDAQAGRAPDHIVLLLNNCTDGTEAVVRSLKPHLSAGLHVRSVSLPPCQANAGHARRLALDAADQLAGDHDVLLTTDADGRVDADWIDANLAALEAGADAVAGWAELDPIDWGRIPLSLHEDDARECAYDAVCDELHALLDPDPADPWPRHTQASGASIAVTASAYRAIGGLPRIATGEDRALIAALRRHDFRVRHAPACRVVVSGRIEGRAAGGMADTIRRRLVAPDPFLDERLEPAQDCARRAMLRFAARAAYHSAEYHQDCWSQFALSEQVVRSVLQEATFGAAWERFESASPTLRRRKVAVSDLARQQAKAEQILDAARRGLPLRPMQILQTMLAEGETKG